MNQNTYIIHDNPQHDDSKIDQQVAAIAAVTGNTHLAADDSTAAAIDLTISENDLTIPAYVNAGYEPETCNDPECPFCELEELRQWKKEAMVLLDEIDFQELGKLLDLKWGDRILPAIIPKIESLKTIVAVQAGTIGQMHEPTENGIFGEDRGPESAPEPAPEPEPGWPDAPRRNRVRCKRCLDIIESHHRHDFRSCRCGAVAVDGGKDYHKRCFSNEDDYEELP